MVTAQREERQAGVDTNDGHLHCCSLEHCDPVGLPATTAMFSVLSTLVPLVASGLGHLTVVIMSEELIF